MFLERMERRNTAFLRAAVDLHQAGEIPPNAYVLDIDAIGENTRLLAEEGRRLGLTVFAMTKQLGRNPVAIRAIVESGIEAGVAVDMQCARALLRGGARLGHVGHLVQVPRGEADAAAAMTPDFWTVFSLAKAAEAAAATEAGRSQRLLARVHDAGDQFYSGHEGGFAAAEIVAAAERLSALDSAQFAGVTTFPALLFDEATGQVRPTPNLATLERVAERLRSAGFTGLEINAPGTTSVEVLRTLADAGVTQVEPGHALTGTTPMHAVADLPERPAMLYLSEVSHQHGERSFCFGGGLYVDPVFAPYQVRALVGPDADAALRNKVDAFLPPPEAIDYYGQLATGAQVGDSVLFGFRAQAFVTRALVAPVRGVATGAPRVEGLWTADGRAAGEVPVR